MLDGVGEEGEGPDDAGAVRAQASLPMALIMFVALALAAVSLVVFVRPGRATASTRRSDETATWTTQARAPPSTRRTVPVT